MELILAQVISDDDDYDDDDPCSGDSGGPLYLESKDRNGDIKERTVVGIVSGGVGCGANPDNHPNYPRWWARVKRNYLIFG